MVEQVPDSILAVNRAYFAGVAVTATLLVFWLIAGSIVTMRAHRAGVSRTRVNLILAVYVLTGYAGYLAALGPVTFWFLRRVAIVEPPFFDPWWVRNGVPAAIVLVCLAIVEYAMRLRPPHGDA